MQFHNDQPAIIDFNFAVNSVFSNVSTYDSNNHPIIEDGFLLLDDEAFFLLDESWFLLLSSLANDFTLLNHLPFYLLSGVLFLLLGG